MGPGSLLVCLLVGLFIAFGLTCWCVAWLRSRRRGRDMIALAGQIGFALVRAPRNRQLADDLSRFNLFQRANSTEVRNVLTDRQVGLTTYLFDYYYTMGPEDPIDYTRTVVAYQRPGLNLPAFELRPERTTETVIPPEPEDIDFEGFETFSERYLLRGVDEPSIREVFSPEVIDFFQQRQRWSAEGDGEWLILYMVKPLLEPREAMDFLADADELAQLICGSRC